MQFSDISLEDKDETDMVSNLLETPSLPSLPTQKIIEPSSSSSEKSMLEQPHPIRAVNKNERLSIRARKSSILTSTPEIDRLKLKAKNKKIKMRSGSRQQIEPMPLKNVGGVSVGD